MMAFDILDADGSGVIEIQVIEIAHDMMHSNAEPFRN